MPLYEYECEACRSRFEVIQKFSDPRVEVCTKCGQGPVQRLFSSPAIQFKGSGWYITDYSQKGKPSSESSSGDAGEKKADTKETKEKTTKDSGDAKAPASGSGTTASSDSKPPTTTASSK